MTFFSSLHENTKIISIYPTTLLDDLHVFIQINLYTNNYVYFKVTTLRSVVLSYLNIFNIDVCFT